MNPINLPPNGKYRGDSGRSHRGFASRSTPNQRKATERKKRRKQEREKKLARQAAARGITVAQLQAQQAQEVAVLRQSSVVRVPPRPTPSYDRYW